MRKTSLFLISIILFTSVVYGAGRECENLYYTDLYGAKRFLSIHCTEKVDLTRAKMNIDDYKKFPVNKVSNFIYDNSREVIEYIDLLESGSGIVDTIQETSSGIIDTIQEATGEIVDDIQETYEEVVDGELGNDSKESGTGVIDGNEGSILSPCESLSNISIVKDFENTIYSHNGITYDGVLSDIETIEEDLESLQEQHDSETLYTEIYDSVKSTYPSEDDIFIKNETKSQYFDRQKDIKNEMITKQEQKLKLFVLYRGSQRAVNSFYDRLEQVCRNYQKEKGRWSAQDEENELIAKYKDEFEDKIGRKLDKMPDEALESLIEALSTYSSTSKIYKRLSDNKKKMFNFKIKALSEVIKDRF